MCLKKLCLSFYHKRVSSRILKNNSCLGENTEKYMTFIVPIEIEVTRMDKSGVEITKIYLTYYNLFIDRARFMAIS